MEHGEVGPTANGTGWDRRTPWRVHLSPISIPPGGVPFSRRRYPRPDMKDKESTRCRPPSPQPPRPFPAPAAGAIDQPRMRPAAGRSTPWRLAAPSSPPRSALAEITLAHGQLEVVAARLALMTTRSDLGPDRMDILDAAHQTHRAPLSMQQARNHIEATMSNHPVSDDRSEASNPHTGSAERTCRTWQSPICAEPTQHNGPDLTGPAVGIQHSANSTSGGGSGQLPGRHPHANLQDTSGLVRLFVSSTMARRQATTPSCTPTAAGLHHVKPARGQVATAN